MNLIVVPFSPITKGCEVSVPCGKSPAVICRFISVNDSGAPMVRPSAWKGSPTWRVGRSGLPCTRSEGWPVYVGSMYPGALYAPT